MAAMMTRVSSQPWTKALMRLATKMVTKKMNMPIFSPIPSCSLFKSLDFFEKGFLFRRYIREREI